MIPSNQILKLKRKLKQKVKEGLFSEYGMELLSLKKGQILVLNALFILTTT